MTSSNANSKVKKKISQIGLPFGSLFALLALAVSLLLSIAFSDQISHSVRSGLSLCANVIIPSVFPFIILSDFLLCNVDFSRIPFAGGVFERIFKINKNGLPAFVLGLICGFPLGVKCASELYRSGQISREEAERLIGFSNNTGPAFLVSGIGSALRGSIADGVLLYLSMIGSAIVTGFIFSFGKSTSKTAAVSIQKKEFSFTESVRAAGLNTLNICSYLTFFACLCGLLRKLLGECYPYLAIIPFLEVGSATSILSKTKLLNSALSLTLSAFAVGFSGFSVHLQALSFLTGSGIKTQKYFLMKLIQGILCAAAISVIYAVIYK